MRRLFSSLLFLPVLALGACSSSNDNAHTTATTIVTPSPTQILTVAARPAWIDSLLGYHLNAASPVVTVLSPQRNETVSGTLKVRVSVRGLLDVYAFVAVSDAGSANGAIIFKDHLHVVVDNLPPQDYFDLAKPFEIEKLAPGRHMLRVCAARPWHESYKNAGSFQIVIFNVAGSKDRGTGAAAVEANSPLLTYNSPTDGFNDTGAASLIVERHLPAGKAETPAPVMIDFWLANASLKGDGGQQRVRYFIDDDDARYIDKWEAIWLKGWTPGKHSVRIELLGADQYPLPNGITTHEITVVK